MLKKLKIALHCSSQAVLNPLQAVFNLLLYKSPKKRRAIASLSALREWWTSIRLAKRIEADEDTPLLL